MKINSPFDLINNITMKTGFIKDSSIYSKHLFLAIKFLSYVSEYVEITLEISKQSYSNDKKYMMLYKLIPNKKIIIDYPKKVDETKIEIIMGYYGYSKQQALDVELLIPDSDLDEMSTKLNLRKEYGI